LLEEKQLPTPDAVKSLMDIYRHERLKVSVDEPVLADYDQLLLSDNNDREEVAI